MGELGRPKAPPAITVKELSFAYGEKPVLENCSANIESHLFTVILGKNGSGKSTLLRIFAGLLSYRHGEVRIGGRVLEKLKLRERAQILGFLGQKHKAIFPFTVEQVVLTGRAGYINFIPAENDVDIARNAMEKVSIRHLKDRIYTELSGGEQQLVMIARVLAQEPRILLLDEPTTHLDFSNQIRLLTLLRALTYKNLTVIAVLHDPNIAFLYGDNFLFVSNGKLIRPEEPVKPWSAEFLQVVYGHGLQSVPYAGRALIVPEL